MYSPSTTTPMESYQVVIPSDNQTSFQPGQVIRYTIPRQSAPFFDARQSKLQFLVRTSGANYKMCFLSDKCGIASMVNMVRLSQNGTVISEITDYNTLQHFVKTYEKSLSPLQKDAVVQGCVDYIETAATESFASSSGVLVGQGLNRSGQNGSIAMEQNVKFNMYLDMVSLFEILELVPMILMGDVLLEIGLVSDKHQIMKVLPATGIAHGITAIANPVPAGTNSVTLTAPFTGFTCLSDSPYIVGQSVVLGTAAVEGTAEFVIQSLSQGVNDGAITMTFTGVIPDDTVANGGGQSATNIKIVKGSDGAQDPTDADFIVDSATMLLLVVKPPQSYVQSLGEMVMEGMAIDVPSVSAYRSTVIANVTQQTITIPTTQNRCKSAFTVLQSANQTPTFTIDNSDDFQLNGSYDGLLSYRSQINGIYYPNLPVSCSQFLGGLHFAQEHIRELEKAFDSSDFPMRSIDSVKQNFVLGRALSSYGSSTNLTATPINVYLTYSAAPAVKTAISFVTHTNRVTIGSGGIEVFM